MVYLIAAWLLFGLFFLLAMMYDMAQYNGAYCILPWVCYIYYVMSTLVTKAEISDEGLRVRRLLWPEQVIRYEDICEVKINRVYNNGTYHVGVVRYGKGPLNVVRIRMAYGTKKNRIRSNGFIKALARVAGLRRTTTTRGRVVFVR